MGFSVLFYKLFQFKADLAAILKRYCCHGNVTYKSRHLPQFKSTYLIPTKNNYCSDILFKLCIFRFYQKV